MKTNDARQPAGHWNSPSNPARQHWDRVFEALPGDSLELDWGNEIPLGDGTWFVPTEWRASCPAVDPRHCRGYEVWPDSAYREFAFRRFLVTIGMLSWIPPNLAADQPMGGVFCSKSVLSPSHDSAALMLTRYPGTFWHACDFKRHWPSVAKIADLLVEAEALATSPRDETPAEARCSSGMEPAHEV